MKTLKLMGHGFYQDLDWSPDGKHLAYADNSMSTYVIDVKTGVAKLVGSNAVYGPAGLADMTHAWSPDSKTNVAHMTADDFRSNEKSAVISAAGSVRIEMVADDGTVTVLKESVPVLAGEVIDATVMRVAALRTFLAASG